MQKFVTVTYQTRQKNKISSIFIRSWIKKKGNDEQRVKTSFFKNGKAYFNVTKGTKGGKPRIVEICGVSEVKQNDSRMDSIERGKAIPKLNTQSRHLLQGQVCSKNLAIVAQRKEKDIPPRERYIMRKERAGEVQDKLAMEIVLGHNRISVIARNRIYTTKTNERSAKQQALCL